MSLKTFILSGIREVLEDKFDYCPGGKDTLIPPRPPNSEQQVSPLLLQGVHAQHQRGYSTNGTYWQYQGSQTYVDNSTQGVQGGGKLYPTLPTADAYNFKLEEYSNQRQHVGTRIYPALPQDGNNTLNCPAAVLPPNSGDHSYTVFPQEGGVLYFEQKGIWMPGAPGTPSILPVPNFSATEDAQKLRKALNGNDKMEALSFLCARTNWQRQEISKVFKSKYGEDLIKDLISVLESEYENVILALMEPSAVYDAKQLHKAMQGLSTEDSMLIECMNYMTSRNNEQFFQIRKVYKELYHRDLEAELSNKERGGFQRHLVSLCAKGKTEPNAYRRNEQNFYNTDTEHYSENIDYRKNDARSQSTGAEASIIGGTHHTENRLNESNDNSSQLDKLYRAEELDEGTGYASNMDVESPLSCSGILSNVDKSEARVTTEKTSSGGEYVLAVDKSSRLSELRTGTDTTTTTGGYNMQMQTKTDTGEVHVTTEKTSSGGEYVLAVDKSSQLSELRTGTDTTTTTGGYNMQMQTKTDTGEVHVTTEKTSSGGEYELAVDKSSQLSQLRTETDTTTTTGGYNMQMQTKTDTAGTHVTTEKTSSGGEYELALDKSSRLSQLRSETDTTTTTGGYNMQMQTKTDTAGTHVTTEKTSSGGEYELALDKSSQLSQLRSETDTTTTTGGYNMQMQTKIRTGEVCITTEKTSSGGEYVLAVDKSSQLSELRTGTDTTTTTGGYNMQMQTKTDTGEVHVTTEKTSNGGEYVLAVDKSSQLSELRTGTDTTTTTGGYNMQMQTKTDTGEVHVTTEKTSSGGEYELALDKSSRLSQLRTETDTTTTTGGYNMQMQTKTDTAGTHVTTEKTSSGGEYELALDKSSRLSQLRTETDTTTTTGGYNMQMQTKIRTGEVCITTEKTLSGGEYELALDKTSQLRQTETDTKTTTGGYNIQMQTKTDTAGTHVTTEKTSSGGEYELALDKSSQLSERRTGTDTTATTGGYNMQMQTKTDTAGTHVTTEKISSGGEYELAVDKSSQLSQLRTGTDTTTTAGGYNMQMQLEVNVTEVHVPNTTSSADRHFEMKEMGAINGATKTEDLYADVDKQTYGSLHIENAASIGESGLNDYCSVKYGRCTDMTKSKNIEIRLADKTRPSRTTNHSSGEGNSYTSQELHTKSEDLSDGGKVRIVTSTFCITDERRFQQFDSNISHRVTEKFSISSEGGSETDEMLFNEILTTNNFLNLEAMFDKYQKETKQSIEKAIDSQFNGYIRNGLLATVGVVRNRPGYFAKVLHEIIESHGSRDDDLMRLIISRCEYDMADIKKQFQDMYKVSLEDTINAKYTGVYKEVFTTLVNGNRH